MEHSPGHWYYWTSPNATHAEIMEPDGTTVAELHTLENSVAHSRLPANARLMASAPMMLDALRRLVHPAADDTDLENALDVIARATGAA